MADVVRNTLQMMKGLGFGGDEMTARILSRACWKLSARSVGRIRRTGSRPLTPPTDDGHKTRNPVVARFVNHTWMMDATLVQTFLNGQYREVHVAGVFDAFSRVPLVLKTFDTKPGASAMARLLRTAVKAFGKAKYVITDQGGEFTGAVFRKTAARLGIVHRFGTVGRIFATARLERFWRTLKLTAKLKYDQPLTVADLEGRLETALNYYLCFRPHQGLHGATPAEAFLGIVPSCAKAISPPRGRPGEGPQEAPFPIGFLDPDKRALPILRAA
jgi:transposase InsO family protein